MIGWLLALAGALAGAVQTHLLARSTRQGPGIFSFAIRLLLVGTVLLAAAWAGHLPAATAGWILGFAAGLAVQVRWVK